MRGLSNNFDDGMKWLLSNERYCLIVLCVIWLAGMGVRPLANPDEGRYAAIALEMALSNDWITPRLNGLLYFEKPVLQYWVTGLMFKCFGFHDWVARLLPALSGLGVAWLTRDLLIRFCNRAVGLAGFALLLISPVFFAFGHILTLDMPLALFMSLWLWSAVQILERGELTSRYITTAWFAMAMSVLTKGLVGLLIPSASWLIWAFCSGRWRLFWSVFSVRGIVLFLLLTVPWFWAVQAANPDFFHFFFIHEHVDRYLSDDHNRPGSWWYYLPLLALSFCFMLGRVAAFFSRLIDVARTRAWKAPTTLWQSFRAAPAGIQLLLVYSVFFLAFFSASHSKLPGYLVPCLSPLLVCLMWADSQRGKASEPMQPTQPIMRLALIVSSLLTGVLVAYPTLDAKNKDEPAMAAYLQRSLDLQAPVFSVGYYNHALGAYLHNRRQILVGFRDELDFGLNHQPEQYIDTPQVWLAVWNGLPHGAALIPLPLYESLFPSLCDTCSEKRYRDIMLVIK